MFAVTPQVAMVRRKSAGRMTPAWTKSTVGRLFPGGRLPLPAGGLGTFPRLLYLSVYEVVAPVPLGEPRCMCGLYNVLFVIK